MTRAVYPVRAGRAPGETQLGTSFDRHTVELKTDGKRGVVEKATITASSSLTVPVARGEHVIASAQTLYGIAISSPGTV